MEMLKVQGIVTKRCQTWKKLIPTVKIWGKKLGSSERNMLSCAKTKLPQAEQTMKQQQRKKENFPLLYPHAYMSLETKKKKCILGIPRMHDWSSYDWSSAAIVNLTEQATHVPKTRVLTSVKSNLRFILPSLTHTFLFNKYKKLN